MIDDPDHPGPQVESNSRLESKLRSVCTRLSSAMEPRFPGSQPVSLLEDHLDTLATQDFMVCEKSDGVRYLLLLHGPDPRGPVSAYLVSRKFQFYPLKTLAVPVLPVSFQ